MTTRFKKKVKGRQSDDESSVSEEPSYFRVPSRNILAALDERINELERGRRMYERSKCTATQNNHRGQRPHSVPSKTLYFHSKSTQRSDVEEESSENQTSCYRSKCAWCNARRSKTVMTTTPSRKKMAMERMLDKAQKKHSTVSSDRMHGHCDYLADVYESPQAAKTCRDFSDSASQSDGMKYSRPTRHKCQYEEPDYLRSFVSKKQDKSPVSPDWATRLKQKNTPLYPSRDYRRYGRLSALSSQGLVNDYAGFSEVLISCRNSLKNDTQLDNLLAKYSDRSYPKVISPRTIQYSYKSNFMTSQWPGKNFFRTKSPRLFPLTRTSSRNPLSTFTSSSLASKSVGMFNSFMTRLEPRESNFNKSLNCSYDADPYHTFASGSLETDPLLGSKNSFRSMNSLFSTISKRMRELDNFIGLDKNNQQWLDSRSRWSRTRHSSLLGDSVNWDSFRNNNSDVLSDNTFKNRYYFFKANDPTMPEAYNGSLGDNYSSRLNEKVFLSYLDRYEENEPISSKKYGYYPSTEHFRKMNFNGSRSCPSTLRQTVGNRYQNDENNEQNSKKIFEKLRFSFQMQPFGSLPGVREDTFASPWNYTKFLDLENSCLRFANKLNSAQRLYSHLEPRDRQTTHSDTMGKNLEEDENDKGLKLNLKYNNYPKEKNVPS